MVTSLQQFKTKRKTRVRTLNPVSLKNHHNPDLRNNDLPSTAQKKKARQRMMRKRERTMGRREKMKAPSPRAKVVLSGSPRIPSNLLSLLRSREKAKRGAASKTMMRKRAKMKKASMSLKKGRSLPGRWALRRRSSLRATRTLKARTLRANNPSIRVPKSQNPRGLNLKNPKVKNLRAKFPSLMPKRKYLPQSKTTERKTRMTRKKEKMMERVGKGK